MNRSAKQEYQLKGALIALKTDRLRTLLDEVYELRSDIEEHEAERQELLMKMQKDNQ